VLFKAVVKINGRQFGAQAAIKIFDDSVVALHCGLLSALSDSCGAVRAGESTPPTAR
jgi:hypothetical protein